MKLGSLIRFILRGGKRTIRCESCGNEFGCSVAGGCWCAAVEVGGATRAGLRRKFRDCLCPDCLGRHAASGHRKES
ncbi:MAG TPA: cysteine-rich CWC family protein [Terriglobia bacterium]|nr:cysteine-rich CWC family protein [Terriglobia bacterium]